MSEYLGESGYRYKPLSDSKRHLLLPAYRRHCPSPAQGAAFLDVGCGNGVFSCVAQGYRYVGIDRSEVMIARARTEYPGEYVIGSATELTRHFAPCEFDTILMSMLFPSFKTIGEIITTLHEARTVLSADGTVLVGVTHPSFDWYMQSGLFSKPGVDCEFKGYFSSGDQFTIHKEEFEFHDTHWMLADYARALDEAGFCMKTIDECPPDPAADPALIAQRSIFPTYMVIVAQPRP
jgi:SAM-dependent methyltransferase